MPKAFLSLSRPLLLIIAMTHALRADASVIAVNFDVEVHSRSTHNGAPAQGGANWVDDLSYAGDTFSFQFLFASADVRSLDSLASLASTTPLTGVAATPLSNELLSFYTPHAFETLTAFNSFSENAFPGDTGGSVRFFNGLVASDTSFLWDSSVFSDYTLLLDHSYDDITFDIQQFIDGYSITAHDLVDRFSELSSENAVFSFEQTATSYTGTYSDFLNETGLLTGLSYRGIARVASVGPVNPVPVTGSLGLLSLGLLLLSKYARIRRCQKAWKRQPPNK